MRSSVRAAVNARRTQPQPLLTILEEQAGSMSLLTPEEQERFHFDMLREAEEAASTSGGAAPADADQIRQHKPVNDTRTESHAAAGTFVAETPHPEQKQSWHEQYDDTGSPEEDSVYQDEEQYSMGLKQREKLIDELKKENFGLKMRIYFLTENLQKLSPEGVREIVNEHAELRALVEDMRLEARLREEAAAEIQKQPDVASLTKIADLERRIDELETGLVTKSKEAENAAIEMQEAFKTILSEGQAHETELKKWREKVAELEEQLAQRRESNSNAPDRAHASTAQSDVSSDTEIGSPLSLRGKVAKYKRKMEEFRTISLCTTEEMAYLKSELERQTDKLRELEEKFRDDAARQRSSGDDRPKSQKRKVVAAAKDAENVAVEEIRTSQVAADAKAAATKEPRADKTSSDGLGKEMRILLERLRSKLGIESKPDANLTQLSDMFKQILAAIPTKDLYDENRKRYISELKQRNTLLVHIHQSLEKLLVDHAKPAKPIGCFADLKESIQQKMDTLKQQVEEYDAMTVEKRLWKTKMSAMEAKVARALQSDRRVAPAAVPTHPGLGATMVGGSSPTHAHVEHNKSLKDAASGRKEGATKTEDDQYGELHDTIKSLQAKLEISRQEVSIEREGAERRVSELLETNRKLEEDMLHFSKALAELESKGVIGFVAKQDLPAEGSPERAKLKRINEELRADLFDQIHQGGTMREQLRKTKLQYGKALAEVERLQRQVHVRDRAVLDACRKLGVLNDRRGLDDVAVIKQIVDSVRRQLSELAESKGPVAEPLPVLVRHADSNLLINPVAPAAS